MGKMAEVNYLIFLFTEKIYKKTSLDRRFIAE
jgi:hypothetical protein